LIDFLISFSFLQFRSQRMTAWPNRAAVTIPEALNAAVHEALDVVEALVVLADQIILVSTDLLTDATTQSSGEMCNLKERKNERILFIPSFRFFRRYIFSFADTYTPKIK
jgi:hypothetical protein